MVKKGNNEGGNWWGQRSFLGKVGIIFAILIFFLIVYFMTFVIVRPFQGEITQDRPIIRELCEMQTKCDPSVGPYICFARQNEVSGNLIKWKNYNGCNESTEGYFFDNDNKRGYINVEVCNCDGLM